MKHIEINIPETLKAYIAGLVDGEGCLNMYKLRSKSCKQGWTFAGRMAISNCDLEALMEVQQETGLGNIQKKTKSPRRRDSYNLVYSPRELRALLPHLLPYLKIKKRQAVLLIKFLNTQKWGNSRGYFVTDEMWKDRLGMREELGFLNRRGNRDNEKLEVQ